MRQTVILFVLLTAVGLGTHAAAEPENTPVACQDGIDNDQDSWIDCDDQDCGLFVFCQPAAVPPPAPAPAAATTPPPASPPAPLPVENHPVVCQDGIDNDGDGLIDCQEEVCSRFPFCKDAAEPAVATAPVPPVPASSTPATKPAPGPIATSNATLGTNAVAMAKSLQKDFVRERYGDLAGQRFASGQSAELGGMFPWMIGLSTMTIGLMVAGDAWESGGYDWDKAIAGYSVANAGMLISSIGGWIMAGGLARQIRVVRELGLPVNDISGALWLGAILQTSFSVPAILLLSAFMADEGDGFEIGGLISGLCGVLGSLPLVIGMGKTNRMIGSALADAEASAAVRRSRTMPTFGLGAVPLREGAAVAVVGRF